MLTFTSSLDKFFRPYSKRDFILFVLFILNPIDATIAETIYLSLYSQNTLKLSMKKSVGSDYFGRL